MGPALEIETLDDQTLVPFDELERRSAGGRVSVGSLLDGGTGATHATFESSAGDYRASVPLDVARTKGVVILEPTGGLRLVIEDGETLCWNVKDLGHIRLTVGREPDSVPEVPSH